MLTARISSQTDRNFKTGRHEYLSVHYISWNYFGLPRQSIRKSSDRLILLKQTLRDVESMYKDIWCYDMKTPEFKEMCRKAWSEKLNYLCIDLTKYKMEVNIVFSIETKTHILNAFPKVKFFSFLNVVSK